MHKPKRPYPVIVDTSNSPYARLKPVPLTAVSLTDAFWAPRLRINREITLPGQYRLLEDTGRIDNFRRAAAKKHIPFPGRYYNDSDVYKWLEAVAWTLASGRAPELATMADTVIAEIADAQEANGYLNTYFMFERAAERWTNLRDMHELYCAGHLMQAAVAHHRSTGQDRLLNVARRFADNICALFGPPEDGKRAGIPGHEEIEMALVELARDTGEPSYLKGAAYFVDSRGQGLIGGDPYHQDQIPLREMERMVGHAVRAVYLTAGATDLYADRGDTVLHEALFRLWSNMTARQTYISGAIGSRYSGEAFGDDYELPNARAYAETCAAIGSIMWNWRMLALQGDARYADLIETTLYNAFLASLSVDGEHYFYQNPLADAGAHRRQPWFDCACCPPNIARLLASLTGYFCNVSDDGVWLHLYAAGSIQLTHPQHGPIHLAVDTRYPWDSTIDILVNGRGLFSLFLRIPAWCEEGVRLEINGQPFAAELAPGAYVPLHRTWTDGDHVRLFLPMPVRVVECHPYVLENAGHVAVLRGPLLYCVEAADNPAADLSDMVLSSDASLAAEFQPETLGGVTVLKGHAHIVPPDPRWDGRLYQTAQAAADRPPRQIAPITAVPYYAWANREPGAMRVWLRRQPAAD
jgi:DUF1680 family protein